MSIAHKVNGTWQKTAGLPPVDSVLSSTSQNPLENRQIYAALADKITASVSNLVNYYKKSETYTQAEVRQLIGSISTLSIKVVASLPTSDISTTTIYWVGPDATTGKYDQYIYADNAWVKTGDTSVNLGDYVTTEGLELAIADFLTEDDVEAILASYYTKTEIDTLLNGKQDSLTFDNAPTEDSNNVVKSGGVYSAVDDVYKVMGENGAKNLIPYPPYIQTHLTHRGITFDVNEDGSVNFEGTGTDSNPALMGIIEGTMILPAGSYTLSGGTNSYGGVDVYFFDDSKCTEDYSGTYTGLVLNGNYVHISTVRTGTYFNQNNLYGYEKTFTIDQQAYIRIQIRSVNNSYTSEVSGTVYPMLRLAFDIDNTWQPYAKTNKQLTEDKAKQADEIADIVNFYGAKNLIPYPYYHTTMTRNGITFTDNGDGSVTINGTSTVRNTNFYFVFHMDKELLPFGSYTLSAKGLTNAPSGVTVGFNNSLGNTWVRNIATIRSGRESYTFTHADGADYDNIGMYIQITDVGTTVDNITVYPMLRLASIQDDTWQPYVKTNKELTDKLKIEDVVITPSTGITIDYTHCYKIGNIVLLNFRFILEETATVADDAVIATIDKKPKSQVLLPSFKTWDGSVGDMVQINTNGNLIMSKVYQFASGKNYFINACYVTED